MHAYGHDIADRWLLKDDTEANEVMGQEDKPQSQEKFHVRRGDPSIVSFADYSQRSASQVLQEKSHSAAD